MESKSNIPIRKSWGQNFIIDKNIINKIIKSIDPNSNDTILEIGPGKGALTIPLSSKVKDIIAIEIDPMLCDFLNSKNIKNLNLFKYYPFLEKIYDSENEGFIKLKFKIFEINYEKFDEMNREE